MSSGYTHVTIDIMEFLLDLPRENLVDIIKTIDDSVGDWDFTRDLRDYFVSEMARVDE